MKYILGVLLIIGGICGGIYFGLWWAFIGGIIQIIEQLRAPNLDAFTVAFGIVKILFSGIIGWGTLLFCTFLGAACCSTPSHASYSYRRTMRKPPERNRK